MTSNGLPKILPSFDEPIELLLACHEKIRLHCTMLEKLADHIKQHGGDNEAKSAARQIREYFTKSGKLHSQDEEDDLFPLLIRQSLKIADLVNKLENEHRQLDALWQDIEPCLVEINGMDIEKFSRDIRIFCALHRAHLAREETKFFPLIRQSLSQKQLQDIGRSMAKRRGVVTDF